MEKNLQFSEAQLEIMRIIWDSGGKMMFSDLSADLARKNKNWKTNTVLTFLSRLAERGALAVRKQGRLNEYVALVSEEEYLSQQTKSFIENVYGGSAKHLMSALLKQDYLTQADYDELKEFWDGGERRG